MLYLVTPKLSWDVTIQDVASESSNYSKSHNTARFEWPIVSLYCSLNMPVYTPVDENLIIVLQSLEPLEAMERWAAHAHHSDQNVIIMVCLLIAPYHNYYDGISFHILSALVFCLTASYCRGVINLNYLENGCFVQLCPGPRTKQPTLVAQLQGSERTSPTFL